MNNMLLKTLLSYFKVEISNKIDLIDNELIVKFENGKKTKVIILNI